ncbi:MAG: ComEC/Rec2 family competence protein [Isosphaeraceae bacterium]
MTGPRAKPPPRVAPLVPLAIAVASGIVLDRYLQPWETSVWVAIGALVAALGIGLNRFPRLSAAAVALAWLAVGAGRHHQFWFDPPPDDLARVVTEEARPCWIRGVLRDVQGYRPGFIEGQEGLTRAILEVSHVHDRGSWRVASGRALLTVAGDRSDLRAGTLVEAAGALGLVTPPLNPGEFDARDALRSQGVRLRFSAGGPSGVWRAEGTPPGGPRWRVIRWLGATRAWSQATLNRSLDPSSAALANALLLGRREGIAPEVNDAFARTGTTHLLAISGLHLQVLAVALGWTLRGLGLSRRATFGAVALATAGYAGLVGLMPSVVRSTAMTLTYCLAGLLCRRARPANSLALAGLVTLALNPSHLFDAGCQLSFLAVGAILWGVPPAMAWLFPEPDPLTRVERHFWPRWKRLGWGLGRRAVAGLTLSTVVWLVTLPLVALRFHLVSPISILLNIPLVPLTSLALLSAGISLGLSATGTAVAGPAAWACSTLLAMTEGIVTWGVSQRWGYAFAPGPPVGLVLAFHAALGLATASAFLQWRRPGRKCLVALTTALAPILLASTFGFRPWPSRVAPEVDVLAVGHGLSVVIDPGGGRAILYDCGRMRDPSVGRRIVAPALWSRGIRAIDAVILSHADADHYDGLPDVLDRFRVGALLVPPGFGDHPDSDPGAVELLRLARSMGVPVREVVAGERWESGPFRLAILHPPSGWQPPGASDNARSLALDLAAPGGRTLLTGDLDGPGLVELTGALPQEPLDAMLAPHHGGRSANPPWLYARTAPKVVVVSQRSPAEGTRDPLGEITPPPLRTWERGAIRLTWSKSGVTARGYRDP